MMGSMAIAACDSQYPSACCFGSSERKLSALSWIKPVSPTRSTSVDSCFGAELLVCATALHMEQNNTQMMDKNSRFTDLSFGSEQTFYGKRICRNPRFVASFLTSSAFFS